MQLEGGALLKDDFVRFSEKYVLYCNITSHVPGTKDQDLLEAKGGEGFPYLIFMDSDGNLLAKHEGPRSAEGFTQTGDKARGFLDLKAKAEKGDAATKIDFIVAQLELGHIKAGEAQVKVRESGGKPSPEQQKKIDGVVANQEIETVLRAIKDPAGKNAAAKSLYERYKAGKAAPTAEPWMPAYWNLVMEHAESIKDVAGFEESFKILKGKYGDVPQAQKYFQEKEESLKKLKEEKK